MATATETEQERKVREEQEAHERELEEQREADARAHEEGKLLDDERFLSEELALPKIDGEGVDKIAIGFSGRVMLDRSSPADVALIRAMALGKDVTLMVEGKVSKKGHGFTTNKEGDLDAVVFETGVKVELVYKPVTPDA